MPIDKTGRGINGLFDVCKMKHIAFYNEMARNVANLSSAKKRQVGAVVVTPKLGIFIGYNGMPEGMSNDCEDISGKTLPYVIHAEANALDKMAQEGVSAKGSVIFTTTYPCVECAKRIVQSGVRFIVYQDEYKTDIAQGLFKHFNIFVIKESELIKITEANK